MNAIVEAKTPRASILSKMAARFSVEPNKLLDTLKATAFKGQVSNEQMISLLIVADQYGLNPFTKEIYAFPDKGGVTPVVGVDGWARIVNEHPQFDGMSFSFADDGSACTCTIHRKDRSHPISVTEYMSECKRGTQPWQSHPRRMLRHKAMVQAARLAFGFAGIHDEDEAQRIREMGMVDEVVAPKATTADRLAAVRSATAGVSAEEKKAVIDADTGEITAPVADDFVAEMEAAERGEVAA
jgi:phage recombination protein Bet